MTRSSPDSPLDPEAVGPGSPLREVRSHLHPHCFVCGVDHPCGLRVDFRPSASGGVEGVFSCEPTWEGLAGRIHGGVVAALLDGAMSNALMALGVEAVTADFYVRYLHPVAVGLEARVEARRQGQRGAVHDMEAELVQSGIIKARAKARFYDGQEAPWP